MSTKTMFTRKELWPMVSLGNRWAIAGFISCSRQGEIHHALRTGMGRRARWQPGQHVNWGDHPAECFSYSLVMVAYGCYWVLVADFDQNISKSITNCWSQFFLESSDTCEFKELGIFKITLSGFVPWWSSSTREFAPQRVAISTFVSLRDFQTVSP